MIRTKLKRRDPQAKQSGMMRFGLSADDLNSTARELERLLDVEFVLHESSFRGGDYYLAMMSMGQLFLQRNVDVLDNEPFEPTWPSNKLILYLDSSDEGSSTAIELILRDAEALEVARLE